MSDVPLTAEALYDLLSPHAEDVRAIAAGKTWAVLVCGDAMKILPLLPPKCIHLIMTDPPYGHRNNDDDLIANREKALGRNVEAPSRPIPNDDSDSSESLFDSLVGEVPRLLVPGGAICCCCSGGGPDPQFARWSLKLNDAPGLRFKQMIVWDKGPMGMGWHYRRSYETILVAERTGAASRWFDSTLRIENIIRPGQYGIRKIIPRAHNHPTEKPPALAAFFIRLHTQPGDIVLDPFMGSGSFGEAALELERNFIGIEIEPTFFANAAKRLEGAIARVALF